MSWLQLISDWLTSHSSAVQAAAAVASVLLTAALVWTTIRYVRSTAEILEESRKAREAAERQAATSEENLELLKREYEDRIGEGPQIISQALSGALKSIAYWIGQTMEGIHRPGHIPNPEGLISADLLSARNHARRVSDQCAEQISAAIDEMRLARSDIERMKQAALHGPQYLPGAGAPPAVNHLERARSHLYTAVQLLAESAKSRSQTDS